MAILSDRLQAPSTTSTAPPGPPRRSPGYWVRWAASTDHKVIGLLYLATSFVFFVIGGVLAMMIRAELWTPGLQVADSVEQYNELFTMHGTMMLLLFATLRSHNDVAAAFIGGRRR